MSDANAGAGGWGRRVTSGLRALTGVLAGGLVALAIALVAAWFVADTIGSPGPSPAVLVGHGLAAVAAVAAQVLADRRTGPPAALAMTSVVVISVVVLVGRWLV